MIRGVSQISRFALVLGLVALVVDTVSTRPAAQNAPEVDRILSQALERTEWAEAQGFEGYYRCQMTRRVRRFDGDGLVTRDERRQFEVEPVHGVPFARLVARDDQPLNEDERAAEDARKKAFAEAVVDGSHTEDDENEIVFNLDLIERYRFQAEGMEPLRGRLTHRLSFQPRPGRLPVRRNIDRALNNANGMLWIDQATFELTRVEFDLIDTVRLWWGLVGTITQARGSFDRHPVAEEVWAPLQLETFIDARVLFRSSRRAEMNRWRDFEPISLRGQ